MHMSDGLLLRKKRLNELPTFLNLVVLTSLTDKCSISIFSLNFDLVVDIIKCIAIKFFGHCNMLILSRHGLELAFKSRDRKVVCFQVPLSKFFLVYGSMR